MDAVMGDFFCGVRLRIIKTGRIHGYCRQYPDAADWLKKFTAILKVANWRNLQEVRRVFPHADAVEVESDRTVTVFNAKGNHYRLVLALHYNCGKAFVLRFMPHDEYSRGAWKKTL